MGLEPPISSPISSLDIILDWPEAYIGLGGGLHFNLPFQS